MKWEDSKKVLAGTGHRPNKLNNEYSLDGPFSECLKKQLQLLLAKLAPSQTISGMALGFDQLLAICSIENQIPVLAAVPCEGQEKVWPEKSQAFYRRLLKHPLVSQYVVCPGPYHYSKMQLRNRWMCDHADALVAAWDGSSGGTSNCIKYAREIELPIHYLNFPTIAPPQTALFE